MVRALAIAMLCALSLCAEAKVLFTGTSAPGSQGWFGPVMGTETVDPAGFVRLDTSAAAGLQGGYGILEPLLKSDPGFRIDFTARLVSESHGSNDRAGFSVIVTDQNKHGIEIGFWDGEVWAQQLGFKHGASAAFTTTAMTDYSLTVTGSKYRLEAGRATLLAGDTLFYDAPGLLGSDLPYRTANVLFFGDDTTSAAGIFELKSVAVESVPEPGIWLFFTPLLILLALHTRTRRG